MSKLFGYKVNINVLCTNSEREDEPYGFWCESFDSSYSSIEKSKYPDVTSTVDLDKQDGYLVWVEYSSGNSFGGQDGGNSAHVAIFSNVEDAKKLAQLIKKDENKGFEYESKGLTEFIGGDGQRIDLLYKPWSGYFERICAVHVQKVSLNNPEHIKY